MEKEDVLKNLKVLIEEKKLNERVAALGTQISKDYGDEDIFVICILKGAMYFTVDLTKHIKSENLEIDFMKVSSYGDEFISSGNINIIKDIDTSIEGKNVLIVEDIIDSGNTLYYLKELLLKRNPKSLKICALLDKKARRVKDIVPEYIGFEIEDKFIVGYGLDFKDNFRNLPYIGYVEV